MFFHQHNKKKRGVCWPFCVLAQSSLNEVHDRLTLLPSESMFPLISDSYSRPIHWIVVVATFYQTFLLCSHNILQSLGAVPHNFLERSGET